VNRQKIMITAPFLAVFIAALFFVSCGSDYEKPSTTQTGSPLTAASTLKLWIDAGNVNGAGYDRVVILDVTSYGTYTTGHVPGALFVDSADISQSRTEGVAGSANEVLEGSRMDDLVQRYGIDGNTTVVFTGSSLINATRAYFTFRYWGFPKNRLKLLDGLNGNWNTTYGLVPGLSPVVARSGFSVKSNPGLRNDLRVSLSEMIDDADGKIPNVLPIDDRSAATAGSYAGIRGSTTALFNPSGDYTVFEGRIRGAQALDAKTLYNNGTNVFNPSDQLVASFTSIGLDSTKTAYVYCKVGFQGSVAFFVLDGILGWPAAVYDGSWSQWGQLSGDSSMKGQLEASSPWRTDIAGRSDLIVYNYVPVISTPTFTTATGTSDLVVGTVYTSGTNSTFTVEIDSVGTPDTFRWSLNSGATWTSAVAITGGAQTLVSGLTVSFGSTTGHALNDSWTFTATARKNIEQYTADGTVCSASYSANGTSITNSNGGTTACTNKPNSFDTDANRVEEADKAYMNSGGGGSGGSGSVPAGC
jgi:3-mercaptopyruvate sulfurtransferase SseA